MQHRFILADRTIPLDVAAVQRRRVGGLGVKVTNEEVLGLLDGNTVAPDTLCILVTVDGRAARSTPDKMTTPVVGALELPGDDTAFDILALTRAGRAIRVAASEVGPRLARLIRLQDGDVVVTAMLVPNRPETVAPAIVGGGESAAQPVEEYHPAPAYAVLIANAQGEAGVVDAASVRRQRRGAKGSHRGPENIGFAMACGTSSDVVLVTAAGQVLRSATSEVRRAWGRRLATVIRLRDGDHVVGVAVVPGDG